MNGFTAGLITGGLLGVVVTLFVLIVVAGSQSVERNAANPTPNRKAFFGALVLLAICGACFALDLEKSALIALIFSVLLIAKLGGSKRGIIAAGIAAVLLAWFLPPKNSLQVSGLDNRFVLVLFVTGTVVGSVLTEGRQWLKRWVAMANPD